MSEDPVDKLAEDFLERLRRGERPSVAEYIERHPDLADDIREVFPPLLLMEEAARPASSDRSAPARPTPSQLGDYRVLREVGRGGMGVVYEAEQVTLGRHVALKVLPHRIGDEKLRQRFRQEARAAARLHHTNIVPVFGVGEHDGTQFYAMQFIRGRGLDEVVAELRKLRESGASAASGPLEAGDPQAYYRSVARIGLQVADALAYAHKQGVLHRDIKPSNLLLDANGTVWVTDFGLAKEEGTDQLTVTGDIVGTIVYMAPERFHGWADPRSDVYSLGLTLYEMLVLAPAFSDTNYQRLLKKVLDEDPPPPRKFDAAIPKDLETIVMKAIAKEPGQRYRSANQLAKDLNRFLSDEPIRARRATPRERLVLWSRRRPAAVALVAVVILSVAATIGGLIWHNVKLSVQVEAKEEALRRARALGLSSASETVQRSDATLALLLAREASRIALLPEVETRLHGALAASLERATLRGHEGRILDAAFSPLGDRIVTASADLTARLWDRKGASLAILRGHGAEVTHASFSRSGGRILTVSSDGTARLWDGSGAAVAVIGNGKEQVAAAQFAPDADRVLVVMSDGAAMLRDQDGAPLARLGEGAAPVRFARFSPTGHAILLVHVDGTATAWDRAGAALGRFASRGRDIWTAQIVPRGGVLLAFKPCDEADVPPPVLWTGDAELELPGHASAVWRADFVPARRGDELRIVTVSLDGETRLWSRDGEALATLRPPVGFAFPSTEREVFLGSGPPDWWWPFPFPEGGGIFTRVEMQLPLMHVRQILLWDSKGTPVSLFMPPGSVGTSRLSHVRAFRLSPNLRHALFADTEQTAALVTLRTMLEVGGDFDPLSCAAGGFLTARFSPLGDRILTIGTDNAARLWSTEHEGLAALAGSDPDPAPGMSPAVFSPSGRFVIGDCGEGTGIWDAGGNLVRVLDGSDAVIAPGDDRILTFHVLREPPDERTGFAEAGARLWAGSGELIAELPGATEGLFSAAGDRIATRGDGCVRLWDRAGRQIAELPGDGQAVRPLAFSPDGDLVLTRHDGSEPAIRLWDGAGRPVASLEGGGTASFSRDGRRIFIGDHGRARVFDRRGSLLSRFDAPMPEPSPGDRTGHLLPDPTGERWIRCDRHRTCLYDRDGRLICELPGSARPTASMMAPDGTLVVTDAPDDQIRFWGIDGVQVLLGAQPSDFKAACFSPTGDRIVTVSGDGTLRLWSREGRLLLLVRDAPPVESLRFSPDGRLLLTAGRTGCHLWVVDRQELLRLADERVPRELSDAERRRYADLLGPG